MYDHADLYLVLEMKALKCLTRHYSQFIIYTGMIEEVPDPCTSPEFGPQHLVLLHFYGSKTESN